MAFAFCSTVLVCILFTMSDEGGELGGSEAAGGVDRFLRQFSHAMRRKMSCFPPFYHTLKNVIIFINKYFS